MKALETRTRVEIGNVLFPTDFSPAADVAIPYRAEIVRRFGARLFTEILYATDFNPASASAAAYAISLAQEFQAHLTLLHVIAEDKYSDLVHAAELAESTGRLLRNIVPPEAEMWCELHFAVDRGPAAEKILEVAKQRKADLIVLGVRGPSGFPGAATHLPMATAHKVFTHAACPVLTVRG